MSSKTGGPAFPHLRRHVSGDTYEPIAEGGMTLRDYFAAKAMQSFAKEFFNNEARMRDWLADSAKDAYRIADAMLKAKGEKG